MRLGTPPSIRKPIPLTPLVDIVFLLLMFFMLSSNFTKFSLLDLQSSAGGGSASANNSAAPTAIVLISGANAISVNGQTVALAALVEHLNGLRANGVLVAALRATPAATVQDLVTVLETARTSKISEIQVVR